MVGGLWVDAALVVVGAAGLWLGAVQFVGGATRVARRLGVPGLVVGLTVVSFGTSAPEFAVTVDAALAGKADISVGNVVGSNVVNLGFILGGAAMVRGLPVATDLVRRDSAVMLGTFVLLLAFLGDGTVSRLEGGVLLVLLVAYLVVLVRAGGERFRPDATPAGPAVPESADDTVKGAKSTVTGTDGTDAVEDGSGADGTDTAEGGPAADGRSVDSRSFRWFDVARAGLGLAAVAVAAHALVVGAASGAGRFGVSEWVIGVTVVAVGTSAPEFAASLAAVSQGRTNVAAGNVVGSCVFNVLGVLGLAGAIRPLAVADAAVGTTLWLLGIAVLATAMLWTRQVLSRPEGAVLVLANALNWAVNLLR